MERSIAQYEIVVNHNRPDSKCENTRILDSLSDGSEGWLLLCHVTISDDKDGAGREGGSVRANQWVVGCIQ